MSPAELNTARRLIKKIQATARDIAKDARRLEPSLSLTAQNAAVHAQGLLDWLDIVTDEETTSPEPIHPRTA